MTIGGTTTGARNIISGNGSVNVSSGGILISGSYFLSSTAGATDNNLVEGNSIGINAAGSTLPNTGTGISIEGGALYTVVGGTTPGTGNLISGNSGNGVTIDGTGVPDVTPLYLKADGNADNTDVVQSNELTHDGTVVGTVAYGPGVTGQAFLFHDTPGERVVIADGGDGGGFHFLAQPAFTLSAWINLASLPGATPYVIASRAYTSTSESYGLYVNSSGQLVFEWYSSGAFHTLTSTSAALGTRLGVFQQVAVVTDGSTVTFYVNGAAVGSSAIPVPLDETLSGNYALEIGGLSQGSNLFNGLIDEFSLTLAPLTASQIARIFANGGQGTDLGGSGTSGTTIQGNFIGTNTTGTVAIPNSLDGIDIIDALNNTIGGTSAGTLNVISGNTGDGVDILGSEASGNIVEGNFIGADVTGMNALPNSYGVLINASQSLNTIGGPTAVVGTGAGNLISGNVNSGIELATPALVEGNLIGTNVTGKAALGNGTDNPVTGFGAGNGGIYILDDSSAISNDTIGGTAAADRNVISGNNGAGITNNGGDDNVYEGNYIGLDITGTTALSNLNGGIGIVLSSNDIIGGPAPEQAMSSVTTNTSTVPVVKSSSTIWMDHPATRRAMWCKGI